jgi:hypothetical protein
MSALPCLYAVMRLDMHQHLSRNRTDRGKRVHNADSPNFTMRPNERTLRTAGDVCASTGVATAAADGKSRCRARFDARHAMRYRKDIVWTSVYD